MGDSIRYDDLKPLFSGADAQGNYNDNRARLFAHYLNKINGQNITNGFNNNDANATPSNFNEFMVCDNYDNKPNGARDNDIHPDVYQFISEMASYHRALDTPQVVAGVGIQRNVVQILDRCRQVIVDRLGAIANVVAAIVNGVAANQASVDAVVANGNRLTDAMAQAAGVALFNDVIAEVEQQCLVGVGGPQVLNPANLGPQADIERELSNIVQSVCNFTGAGNTVVSFNAWANGAKQNEWSNAIRDRQIGLVQATLQGTNTGGDSIANNPHQKNLFDHLQRWNEFTPLVKAFYNTLVNLIRIDGTNSRTENITRVVGIPQNELGNYRLNFKTINIPALGANANIINNMLPLLGNWAGQVWTSDAVSVAPVQPLFKQRYTDIYNGNVAVPAYVAPTRRTQFGYNLSKYFRSLLADESSAQTSTPDAGVSRILLADDDAQDRFGRNAQGQLTRNDNGTEQPIGRTSNVFNAEATINNRCMTTAVKDADGLTCTNYINDCLTGRNIDACRDYFNSENFWDATQEEVQNMLPSVAIDTLSKFGFGQSMVYDETAKRELLKVDSVQTWLSGLDSVTNDNATKQSIRNNTKLKGYLENLVTLVNRNPAILNQNYSGSSNESKPWNPNRFNYTGLGKFGLKARHALPGTSQRDVELVASAINRENIRLGLRLGVPLFGVPLTVNLVGGGVRQELAVEQLNDTDKYTSTLFNNMFNYYMNKLRSNNKDISDKDKSKIKELIKDLEKKEKQLYEVMSFVEKYSILVSLFGEDQSKGVVSIADIQKAVNARKSIFSKKVKRENDLVSVLRTIVNATQNEASGSRVSNRGRVGNNANL
jgi:hypothetical protein